MPAQESWKNSRLQGEIAGSSPGKLGLSLLQKRSGSLTLVGRLAQEAEPGGLEPEGLVQLQIQAGVHQLEAGSHRERTILENGAKQAGGFGDQPVRGQHPVDQPDAPRLLCVDHRAGEQQLECTPPTDETREADRAAVPRPDAELDLGLTEAGGVARDAEMAGHRQLAAAAEREAIHRREHGLPAALEAPQQLLPRARARLARLG